MFTKQVIWISVCAGMTMVASCAFAQVEPSQVVDTYATVVYKNYEEAYQKALGLQKAVNSLLENPTEETLREAKKAWLDSRGPYGQTEAFRFYEGPIDAENGPEGRINAWPLNEAYIDYVKGNEKAGIVNDPSIMISEETLVKKNASEDEADVTTGYHAIEFLLWGQDLYADGPGRRPASEYLLGDTIRNRRRTYLKVVTDLLVDDLKYLAESWKPGKDNYASKFKTGDTKEALGKILTGVATLSGFELASERIGTALDSGDQEDEHSCFSDNTHNDFIANTKSIDNVYFGVYGDFHGTGLSELAKSANPKLAEQIEKQLAQTRSIVTGLDHPIDRVLASPAGSDSRKKMEALVKSLQEQAELFQKLGQVLGVDARIISE